MASPRERAISPPIEVTDMRGFGSRIWARPFIRAQRVVDGADRARAKKHLLDRAERCATAAWRDVVLDASGLRSDPSVHVLEDDEDPRGGAAARQPASPTAARLAALCLVHDQREDPRLDGPQ